MEKIGWTDRVRNEEVLRRVKEEKNIIHTVKRRKANWIGHIFCRNCLMKHIIEGKIEGRIEVTGRQGRKRKQLLDDHRKKGSARSQSVEHWLWKRLWNFRRRDYVVVVVVVVVVV